MECTIACHVEGMLSKVSNLISFHRSIRIRKLMISEWLVWHLCMYDIRACLRLRRDGRRKLILLSPLRSWTPMQTGFPLTPLTSLIPRISWTLEKGTLLRHQIHRMKFALNWKGWENLIQFSIILFYFFFLLFFLFLFLFGKNYSNVGSHVDRKVFKKKRTRWRYFARIVFWFYHIVSVCVFYLQKSIYIW